MNTRSAIESDEESESLSCSFNQDCSMFSVGLPTGFASKFPPTKANEQMNEQSDSTFSTPIAKTNKLSHLVFNSNPCTPAEIRTEFGNGLGHVEMLNRSNYLALVGGGRSPAYPQHKVTIWNDGSRKKIITLEFRSSVKRVRLSRTKIVVFLKNAVNYYSFAQPPEKLGTCETIDNPKGLGVLSTKHIAFPGRTQGHVQVLDIHSKNISIIPAHTSALAALCISPRGDFIATASEQVNLPRMTLKASTNIVHREPWSGSSQPRTVPK